MAMSKRCFIFALCGIVAIIVGAVVFVVIQMKGHGEEDLDEENVFDGEEDFLLKESQAELDPRKAEMMCESIVNGTEPKLGAYNHPAMFDTTLGVNTFSVRVVTDYESSDTYQKNSYWLTGDSFADREAISMIRAEACQGKIPVIVIKMRPSKGLELSRNIQTWNHYQPKPSLETWTDYDKKLNNYLRYLAPVPSLVIMEPDLLMFSFDTHNLQYGWLNDKYKEEFYQRVQKVIKVMARSWIYVDAGNAAYLKIRENMEHMAKSLLRIDGLRGFSINTAHFFNSSFNNMIARRLHCLTGLHYVTDTSRNGGPFSRQSITGIEKCYFDPPRILRGLPPGWSWGIKLTPRQKRWTPIEPESQPPQQPTQLQHSPQTHPPTSSSSSHPNVIQMPTRVNPPNPQEDPEGYNQWINNMKNNGAHGQNSVFNFNSMQQGSAPQPQPNNHQPMNPNNHNMYNRNNGYNDMALPAGRVPVRAVTAPPTRASFRQVTLRTKEEALAIYRMKTMTRGKCLRIEAVTVHDANVWIKTPGEADGRLYQYGTYHKCLIGHNKPCAENCRLITHVEQRSSACGCEQTNDNGNASPGQNHNSNQENQNTNFNPNSPPSSPEDSGFFPGSDASSNSQSSSQAFNSFPPMQPAGPPASGLSSYTSLADILRHGR